MPLLLQQMGVKKFQLLVISDYVGLTVCPETDSAGMKRIKIHNLLLVTAGLLASTLGTKADLLRLKLDRVAAGSDPSVWIQHTPGASEGLDGIDSPNLFTGGDIDFYSSSYAQLDLNALPPTSFTRITNVVTGIGMPSPVVFNLITSIITESGEFNGKQLYLDIYSISNSLPVFQGTYDARVATNGNPVPLTVVNGHSYNIVVRPEIPNAPPTTISSISLGPKDVVLSGWFVAADNDGVVTNVYATTAPSGFAANGTNWTYAPQGFKGTNTVSFYAVDNMGAASTTNTLTLVTTNNPNLNPAWFTGLTQTNGIVALNAIASPGYEHVLLSSTNLMGFDPVATNVIPYLGTNDMTPTSFSLPAASETSFYKLNSR